MASHHTFLPAGRLLPLAAAACAGILALTSCGNSGAQADASAAGPFPTKGSGTLNLYNWTNYIPPKLVKRFESETGIKVNIDVFESNEQMLAKLQAGGSGYDVVVPSDHMVQQMIKLGLLQQIDAGSFPNGKNIKPEFADDYFDEGRKYTVPYMYGTAGFAYDKTKLSNPPTSWKEFFNPPAAADGKMGLHNDSTEVVGAALRAVGSRPCSETPADYQKVQTLLRSLKPKLKVISSDGTIDRLASGELTLSSIWNGSYHRASVKRKDLEYVYPSEGLTLWQDNLAVPKGAQHVDNAKIFINWMMDPKNMAEASNFTAYDNGITGAEQYMDEALRKDPAITIPADKAALAKPVQPCSQTALDLYDKVWTDFKG
ncbi:extracellular solute-binding protein [Streptomyces atratus]|uniref:extracellular solute-binding protein n=1 Tax=Streptomyces atratus TaxID=1893 RepID=UPI002253FDF6|nr:extracellular solute-binding protein [Streptomyces atratus]MCX5339223.1 extracellular solute-binding protein [Streptomyces atratus]